jgi:hypothetical protein
VKIQNFSRAGTFKKIFKVPWRIWD